MANRTGGGGSSGSRGRGGGTKSATAGGRVSGTDPMMKTVAQISSQCTEQLGVIQHIENRSSYWNGGKPPRPMAKAFKAIATCQAALTDLLQAVNEDLEYHQAQGQTLPTATKRQRGKQLEKQAV